MSSPRVMIIGLDSMPPSQAFETHADKMPFLSGMREKGTWGGLRSTDPPITVPAWVTMTSGRGPGQLGIYGFRSRKPETYAMKLVTPSDLAVDHERIWDTAGRRGLRSAVVSVPLTYPIDCNHNVSMTSCFLTPDHESPWTSTSELRDELTDAFGPYIVDVEEFRTDDRAGVLSGCRDLTRQHFAIFRHLLKTRSPRFSMLVDLGPDRFHHGFLVLAMPTHPRHDPDGKLTAAAAEYYALLDQEIAATAALADEGTVVMVVSDHGVRPLEGAVCVNELLIEKGYLVLEETPTSPTPLSRCKVDWSRTRAWGEGGYHARIFFNVQGREPEGIVPAESLDSERCRLSEILRCMSGSTGAAMNNSVHTPEALYGDPAGAPPDLTVYWNALSMRSVGTVGHRSIFSATNDTGPDDANHDPIGIFAMTGSGARGQVEGLEIADVYATAMDALGLDPLPGTEGRSLLK